MGRIGDILKATKNYLTKDNPNTQLHEIDDTSSDSVMVQDFLQEHPVDTEVKARVDEQVERGKALKIAQNKADELKKNFEQKRTIPKEKDYQDRKNSGVLSRGLPDESKKEVPDIKPLFEFVPESKSTGVIDKFKGLFKKDTNSTFEINEKSTDMPIVPPIPSSYYKMIEDGIRKYKGGDRDEFLEDAKIELKKKGLTTNEIDEQINTIINSVDKESKNVTIPVTPTPAPNVEATPATPANKVTPVAEKKSMLSRWGTNLKEGLISGEGGEKDLDYARRAGYTGGSKEEINSDIESLRSDNNKLKSDVAKAIKEYEQAEEDKKKAFDDYDSTTNKDEKEKYRVIYKDAKNDVDRAKNRIERLTTTIRDNDKKIDNHRRELVKYEELIKKEKERVSSVTKFKKRLENLGEGAGTVTSGLYNEDGGFGTKKDWFGPKGFLKQPFKEANISKNPVSAPGMQNLSYITKSTGSTAGRTMAESITTIKANKTISPMGMPGTIYGARQQFDYNIPAKKISMSDISKSNINPDILPSIFSPPKQVQQLQEVVSQAGIPQESVARVDISQEPVSFKQVTQPDGTVVNVPAPAYRRKSAPIAVMSKRLTHNIKIPVMKSFGNDSRVSRGITSIGSYKPSGFSSGLISQFKQVGKPAMIQSRKPKLFTVSVNRYPHGTDLVTKPRKNVFGDFGIKSFNPEGKIKFTLGLMNNMGINKSKGNTGIDQIAHIEYRDHKKSSPLANMKSILNIGNNLSKMISKRKMKSGKV